MDIVMSKPFRNTTSTGASTTTGTNYQLLDVDEAVDKITSATTIKGAGMTLNTSIIKGSTGYTSIFGRTPRLLTLAQELQDLIYEHLFQGEIISIDFNYRMPGILLACKTTYLSAAPVMYKTAIFKAERPLLCELWLWGMPLDWAQRIREIRLSWVGSRSPCEHQAYIELWPIEAARRSESIDLELSKNRLAMPISECHYIRPDVLRAWLSDTEDRTTTWTSQPRRDFLLCSEKLSPAFQLLATDRAHVGKSVKIRLGKLWVDDKIGEQ